MLDAGINHFIDLTEQGELKPYVAVAEEVARSLGLTIGYERHPVADVSVPRSPEHMASILSAINDALDDGKTVYVHCWGGVGRTGIVIGCWLVRSGHTGDAALRQIAEWWQGMEKVSRKPVSPETCEQRAYVRSWTEPSR